MISSGIKALRIPIPSWVAILITVGFFLCPFFWLKPGFVNFGGDAGRLYFFDPLIHAVTLFRNQTPEGAIIYARVPYEFYLYFLKAILSSPTFMIACDHGIQLALGFFSMYLVIKELCIALGYGKKDPSWVAIVGGMFYIGLVTKVGWPLALQTQNQVFLNPLIFYLLLRFFLSSHAIFLVILLVLTILYSANFGFTSMPQLASFFPFAFVFLWGLFHFIYNRPFPWKKLFLVAILFLGLHAFHILPSVGSLLDKGTTTFSTVFSKSTIQNAGVHYFEMNHDILGKISVELFQPSQWHGQVFLILLIPFITVLGFLKKPSKLLVLLGIFFALTLFLVSANITDLGVQFYRNLFYVPGFLMFRSFDEKWYFAYAFFYSLLFAVSWYSLTYASKRFFLLFFLNLCIVFSVVFRIYPFLQGKTVNTTLYQSNNVSSLFTMDPDLGSAVAFTKNLPPDGNIWTLPLTFPYMQIAYGKEGGAYVGVSIIQQLVGKKDFPGFWSFGPYKESLFTALREENTHSLLQVLSFENIRYVFRNTDERVMENFPGYPYVYPGELYYAKNVIPSIQNQPAYTRLLEQLPLKKIFEKGFYRVYEIDAGVIRPTLYVPDVLYQTQQQALNGTSLRSVFADETTCAALGAHGLFCSGIKDEHPIPTVSFVRKSNELFEITLDLGERKKPFLLVLSEAFHPSWTLEIGGITIKPIAANGYATAWIIDPQKLKDDHDMNGTIRLEFQRYYTYGLAISIIAAVVLVGGLVYMGLHTTRDHAAKKRR